MNLLTNRAEKALKCFIFGNVDKGTLILNLAESVDIAFLDLFYLEVNTSP